MIVYKVDVDSQHIVFLPGMSGHGSFGSPGLGNNPPDPSVAGYDDLVNVVCSHVSGSVVLAGQSMGGYGSMPAKSPAGSPFPFDPAGPRLLCHAGTRGF